MSRWKSRIKFAIPVYIIIIGGSWLLNVLNVVPCVNWVRILGLGVLGVLILVVWGIDNLTFVIGPFLIIASIVSFLRQIGRLEATSETPILTITLGCLVLLIQLLKLPKCGLLDFLRGSEE